MKQRVVTLPKGERVLMFADEITIEHENERSFVFHPSVLLFLIQEYQAEFGGIPVDIGNTADWRGVLGSSGT